MNRALASLEWSRYRSFMPGWKGAALGRLVTIWAVLTFTAYTALHYLPGVTAETLYAEAVIFSYTLGGVLFVTLENMFRLDPARYWWLQLPHSRTLLVKARFQAYSRFGWMNTAVVTAAIVSAYGFRHLSGDAVQLTFRNWTSLIAIAGIAAAGIPILAAGSLFTSVFFGRKWYWLPLFLLYVLVWLLQGPVTMGVIFAVSAEWGHNINDILSPLELWLGLALTAGIGWPLAYGMLRLTARFGLANLADPRNLPTPADRMSNRSIKPSAKAKRAAAVQRPQGSFQALYRMERRRYCVFTETTVVRIMKFLLLAGLAIGGYFSYGHSVAILMVPILGSGAISYFLILYLPVSISMDIQSRRMEWWLTLPAPRWRLLASKISACFREAAAWVFMIYGSFWLGLIGNTLTDPTKPIGALAGEGEWALFVLLLGLFTFTAIVTFFTGSGIVNQVFPSFSLFTTLMIFLPIFYQRKIAAYFFPDLARLGEVSPDWGRFLLAAACSVVLLVITFWSGVRYANRLVQAKPRKTWWSPAK